MRSIRTQVYTFHGRTPLDVITHLSWCKNSSVTGTNRVTAIFAASTAMSLDGGGSSTMVIGGRDGAPRMLNAVIDEGVPGRERAVANHLGIFVKKYETSQVFKTCEVYIAPNHLRSFFNSPEAVF